MIILQSTHYYDLSIKVTRIELNLLIFELTDLDYRILWGFQKGLMILNIYNMETNNKIMFKRHKDYLEMIEAELNCRKVLNTLNKKINFSNKIKSMRRMDKQKNEVYSLIDHYLLELSIYIKVGDKENILKIKTKLMELLSEPEKFKDD